jgi:hypothetical protein
MSEPKGVQRKRTKGFKMPEGAVYVGRPSRWKNPYKIANSERGKGFIVVAVDRWGKSSGERWAGFADKAEAAAFAVDLYKRMLLGSFDSDPGSRKHYLGPLVGKDLACWCALGEPCHRDVLLELTRELALELDNRGAAA